MECYYWTKPKFTGYQQQMHAIWRDKGMSNIIEQRLMDQRSQIRKKKQLTKLELEEIRRTEDESHVKYHVIAKVKLSNGFRFNSMEKVEMYF